MRDRWLLKAIRYCGSQKELAARIGVKPEKVSYWLNYARKISLENALLIEKATNGTIDHRHFLYPAQVKITENFKETIFKQSESRSMSISERATMGFAYEKRLGRKKRTKKSSGNGENFPTKPIRREALAAEYAHFSNYRTYRDAKYVTQRGSPELVQAMDRQCISISTAAQLLRYSPQEQQQILTHNSKEIIAYARRFHKKTHSLPPTVISSRIITVIGILIVHGFRINHKKEDIYG